MPTPYPIVGIQSTGIQPRLEVHDLQKNDIQFSLFNQAMNKVLNMNSPDSQSPDYMDNPNSWWQIAGIHGLPYQPYTGDPGAPQQPDPNSQWEGYCPHASALFPTWHRVVVLLVEQAVVNEAIGIATNLNNDTWLHAAKTLRFPFWDWTRPETSQEGIPKICQDTEVTIVNPNGSQTRVPNPLSHYNFAAKPGGTDYMGDWHRTFRWANRNENPTKEMYDQALQGFTQGASFQLYGGTFQTQPVSWLRSKIAALFTYDLTLNDPSYGPNMWGYFSNTAAQDDGVVTPMTAMPPSLEEPHNMVHLDTGGNGMMSATEYAAFDPIFFLHHCNIDRIFSFWEYLYPHYWLQNGWKNGTGHTVPFITDSGSFWQDPSSIVDQDTALAPFRMSSGDYWTSTQVRSLLNTSPTQKYYTYPSIQDRATGVKVKVDVPYDVNNLALRQRYQQALHKAFSMDTSAVVQAHRQLSGMMPQQTPLLMKEDNGIAHLRQFYINGELPELAHQGSYRLELFMRPNGPRETAGNQVVNNISVLSRAEPNRCAACKGQRAGGSHVRGSMYLDPPIILYLLGRLDDDQRAAITDIDQVAALIQESLGVRLVRPNGTWFASTEPSPGTDYTPLEEAKAPKLTLHSYIIQLKQDGFAPVEIEHRMNHGEFAERSGWKVF